ncbi:hypothetical protein Pmani_034613, partial [Petrolisthes manimaculis]
VFGGEGKRYLSTVDPRRSNWARYLRPAPDRDSANLVVVLRPILEAGCVKIWFGSVRCVLGYNTRHHLGSGADVLGTRPNTRMVTQEDGEDQ